MSSSFIPDNMLCLLPCIHSNHSYNIHIIRPNEKKGYQFFSSPYLPVAGRSRIMKQRTGPVLCSSHFKR